MADATNPPVTDNTCDDLVGDTLGPRAWVTCTFKAQITGNALDEHINEVEVCASQPPSTAATECSVPQDILPSDNYTCNFTGRLFAEDCSIDHTNEVSADTVDDDGTVSNPSDDATVTLSTEIVTAEP